METDRLYLPSNNQLWVDMRRKIKFGDEIAVESAVISANRNAPGQGIAALKRQRIFQLVESWSLRLESDGEIGMTGTPLAMEPISLDRLEVEDGEYLYEYAKHRFEERGDAANPFVPGSPAPSPVSQSPQS